jgi:hypothetical protein
MADENKPEKRAEERFFEIDIADDPTRFPESKLFHLTVRQYMDLRRDDFDPENYDAVAVHDRRYQTYTYVKGTQLNWNNSESNARQHFLAKVPKDAEVVLHYEIDPSGCGSENCAGHFVIQKGIAFIPKKKKAD